VFNDFHAHYQIVLLPSMFTRKRMSQVPSATCYCNIGKCILEHRSKYRLSTQLQHLDGFIGGQIRLKWFQSFDESYPMTLVGQSNVFVDNFFEGVAHFLVRCFFLYLLALKLCSKK
jgi:hypothetical protein